jgi:hypothetical protein
MQDKANSRRKTAELLGVSLRTLDRIRQAPDGLRPVATLRIYLPGFS